MSDYPPPPPGQYPPPQQVGQPYGFPAQKKSNLVRNLIIGAVVGFVLLCGGCFAVIAGTADEVKKASSDSSTKATETPTPSPSPTEISEAPEPVVIETSDEPEPEPTEEVDVTFTMPALVGENLQDAQDTLQSLGSFLLTQTDATGEGRFQVLDANWKVCYQDPAPGTETSLLELVELGAVKLEEACP